ncbi:MAG: PQQ-dependent sugar dehydrogenase [Spirosomaceae bacterium]|jgi:glucose/arabinose dehydrogenase|nr:PQQ-dependent sugar dehydrogenase [Spirosomataceae bacterium]
MKNLLLSVAFLVALAAHAQVSPPIITPASAIINYGQSVSLSVSNCNGTVVWSDGQSGTTASFSPKQSSLLSAVCVVSNQSSAKSIPTQIQVNLTNSPCYNGTDISMNISGVGYRYESATYINATNKIDPDASVQYKAQNNVQLNAGFEAKSGSAFKASVKPCEDYHTLVTREVKTGLTMPWEILWGPDDYIWMTEKGGTISRLNPADGTKNIILTISEVLNYGEGGLLGMVLHPDFANNPYVYIVYNYSIPPHNLPNDVREKVVRYTYSNGVLGSPLILFDNIQGWVNHNGSRLVITPDLKLFITVGDAANTSTPQNDNSVNGKILRINLDGTIPADNPNPVQTPLGAIWSKGHRNPQGMVYVNDKLYVTSHGDNTEDEINLVVKSGNYGYPNVVGPCDTPAETSFCTANSTIDPIFSSGNVTWAFCGLDYYNSNTYPKWKNNLLMVSLKNQTFYTFKLSNDGNTIIGLPTLYYVGRFGRLRDIAVSPAGRVYICTSNGSNDKVIEITPQVD